MRIGISNLAWDVAEDEAIAALLQRYSIDAIDIAPGKYFPDMQAASDADIAKVRAWWQTRGIEITGMQALLFGTTGLNVFGPAEVQAAMLHRLDAVCRIGAGLCAPRLVFGSPRNRDRLHLDPEQAEQAGADFFDRLGTLAAARGVMVCLEPNPVRYGANFMTNSEETARVVRRTGHSAIRMQLDVGASAMNGEAVAEVLARHGDLIGHVHASEPELLPLGDGGADHRSAAAALAAALPDQLVTIEMLATRPEPHARSIERALVVATRAYRGDPPGRVGT